MSITKHTPGPWNVRGCGVYAPDGWLICATGDDETADNSGDTQEANARLVAAAPDMYEALKLLASNPISNEAQKALRAALAKADPTQ